MLALWLLSIANEKLKPARVVVIARERDKTVRTIVESYSKPTRQPQRRVSEVIGIGNTISRSRSPAASFY